MGHRQGIGAVAVLTTASATSVVPHAGMPRLVRACSQTAGLAALAALSNASAECSPLAAKAA